MLLRFHQISINLDEVERALQPDSAGVSMLKIKEVARLFGLDANAIELDPKDLTRLEGPLLAHIAPEARPDRGHFIVIAIPDAADGVWVFDPPLPAKWVSEGDLASANRSIAVLTLQPPRPQNESESATQPSAATTQHQGGT
jgi:ABC-type bacteriocin/lantibiotic exporter with double-glycine peptidase domain